jgi:hypothetical protein
MKHNDVTMAPRIIETKQTELQWIPERAQGVLVIKGPRRRKSTPNQSKREEQNETGTQSPLYGMKGLGQLAMK